MDLSGKVTLVTGAGRGIGWGVAQAFGRAGARVCVTDIDEAGLARSVRDIKRVGGEAVGHMLDVADRAGFRRLAATLVEHWGRIDTLVHCAIYMPLIRFEDLDDREWDRQLEVGLGGLYNGITAVWDAMAAQGRGHVFGIASGSSVHGFVEEVPYCTVKHAQEGLIRALALEAKDRGIALNTVGPGAPVKPTRMTWEELAALDPAEKADWADPADLGRAFVWLASQDPARFTGLRFDAAPIVAALDVDGPDFEVTPERVTIFPEIFRDQRAWQASYRE